MAVGGEGGPSQWADGLPSQTVVADQPSRPIVGVIDELSKALASARATLSNALDLISLEARRAGIALMWMVALGAIAAICMVTAWLGLMAALAMCAVALGLTPVAALIAVSLVNLLAGAVLLKVGIGMSGNLMFSATRRQVAGKSPVPASTS